jgi:hypothetical protein
MIYEISMQAPVVENISVIPLPIEDEITCSLINECNQLSLSPGQTHYICSTRPQRTLWITFL